MDETLLSTPAADGFRMPAEWARHTGCYLIWPERPDNWRAGAKPAQKAWITLIETIAEYEPVTVLVSARQYQNARGSLSEAIRLIETTTDDSWMRDTGPSFVINDAGDVRGVSWTFNAWGGLKGGLYFPWAADDLVAPKVCDIERVRVYQPDFVLEGGSIDVDGEGTVITTEECLLNPNRNPDLTREQVEEMLHAHLGTTKVIWLPQGVYLDETDGHTDNFARFASPGVVMLTWTDDLDDPQYERSAQALKILENETDAQGRRLTVVKITQPGPLFMTDLEAHGVDSTPGSEPRVAGHRLAGSYVNSYIGNGFVVLPVFDDPHDNEAIAIYGELFPHHTIRTVPGREILLGGGNVHCITQQVPRG
ncbi:MAG: agmatine deiminase [Actinomycetes bacterium]